MSSINAELSANPSQPETSRRLKLRATEQVLIAFFAYVALLSVWFPKRPLLGAQPWLFLLAAVTAIFCLAALQPRPRIAFAVSFLRDLLPFVLTLAAFQEMELFRPFHFHHHYEDIWIHWDDLVLRQWHLRSLIQSWGAAIPSFLEGCYLCVYGIGLFGVAVLYLLRRRKQVDHFLLLYVSGTVLAYALFPYFPSQPPRLLFPHLDEPQIQTAMRDLNLWILNVGTIHSSVFPSAHVSSAFSAAWGMFFVLPRRKIIGSAMVAYAICVAVATVYGRYHYVADALAGLGVSLVVGCLAWAYTTKLKRSRNVGLGENV